MLTHLIILLDDTSVSYCHYDVTKTERRLIELDVLKKGIVWGMKENLNIQFVYPDYELPVEYQAAIDSIDNTKIMPLCHSNSADVLVLKNWEEIVPKDSTCIIRTCICDLESHLSTVEKWLSEVSRLNIVLTDIDEFSDEKVDEYSETLDAISVFLAEEYKQQHPVQLNLLTDRILLTKMNNCNAGVSNVTLAPDGNFYLCPAFYYTEQRECVGNPINGLNIKNLQLLCLDHAPLCRRCDAYHCRRCIWQNQKLTLDANTPSHQQCVIAHVERNASRRLMDMIVGKGIRIENWHKIEEIDYLDPFNILNKWK